MNFKDNNLTILRDYYNLDIEKLQSENTEHFYKTEPSRKGDVTVSCEGKYLHSKYDPAAEAEKIIQQTADTSSDCWVFGGFGLGYHLDAFLKFTENAKAVVVEPDISLFIKAAEVRDLSDILLSGRLILIVGGESSSIISTLNMFQFEKIKYFQIRSEYDLNAVYFDSLKDSISSYISRKDVNNNTLIRFGKLWVKNLLLNLPVFADSPGIDSIKGIFSNIPALILAGGPGLDKSLIHLKKYREKLIVIAVDTSMSACLRYGVEPDFLIVVDPQYWNYRHLDRCGFHKTIIISEPSTYPNTFRSPDAEYIFASSVFPLGKKYEDGSFTRGKIGAGGSVSTTAWDFARISGCSPIIFAGLDLSYPDKQTHFKGSFFEERSHTLSGRLMTAALMDYKLLTDASLIEAEDMSGKTVYTDRRLIIYKQWFEEQHRQYKQETLTLSNHGISIKGIKLTDHEYILTLPDFRTDINKILGNFLSEFKKQKGSKEKYIEISEKISSDLYLLKKSAEEGISLCSRLISSSKDTDLLLDKLNRIDMDILSGEARDTAGFLLQEVSRKILTDEKENDFQKIIEKSHDIYLSLVTSADYHINLIEKSVKKLSER